MKFDGLTEIIESSEIITVFRHARPDCDAVGSQFGFISWLKHNYPDKQVYALGNDTCTQSIWPSSDIVDDDTIAHSTAVVLDTANEERVDDQRFATAKTIIKIDHHPNHQPFGTYQYVYEDAAATCEILTHYFLVEPEKSVTLDCAQYLYKGLLTDTLSFSTSNTNPDTFTAACFLVNHGINPAEINRELFDRSYYEFAIANKIRSKIETIDEKLAYVIVTLEDQKAWNVSGTEVKNYITELGHVKEFEIWCIFTEKENEHERMFDGSLRSKTITINDVAEHYNGGGHKNASGVKNLTEISIKALINELFRKI